MFNLNWHSLPWPLVPVHSSGFIPMGDISKVFFFFFFFFIKSIISRVANRLVGMGLYTYITQ